MRVWRICKAEHVATAFTGEGAVLWSTCIATGFR